MRLYLVSILISTTTFMWSQSFNRVFFNEKWNICPADIASYYRTSDFNSSIPCYDGEVTDYYYPSGQIEMTGKYIDCIRTGEFTFYYPNGNIRLIANYDNNGSRDKTWIEYYPNGNVRIEVKYADVKEVLIQLNDSTGHSVLKGKRFRYKYQESDLMNIYYGPLSIKKRQTLTIKGRYVNNLRSGEWTVLYNNRPFTSLKYKDGQLMNGLELYKYNRISPYCTYVYPLISDPVKLQITEGFVKRPGSVIRNNYVLEGLNEHARINSEKTIISNRSELEEFIKTNFLLTSEKPDNYLLITLFIKENRVTDISTIPKIGDSSYKNLKLIMENIEKLDFETTDTLQIRFKLDLTNKYIKK